MRSGGAGAFALGEEFEEEGEDLIAIASVEGEGDLGVQEAVMDAEIVAAAAGFEGEVAFVAGEFGEGGGELEGAGLLGVGAEDMEDGRGEDVHAEEAEVMGGAQTGDKEALLGFGGGGFFNDLGDVVEVGMAGEALTADGAVEGQFAFVGALDGGHGAAMGGGGIDELPGAALFGGGDVEVIADEEEEGIIAGEGTCGEDGMAEAAGIGLFDELEAISMRAGGRAERLLIAGGDHHGDVIDTGGEGFLDDNGEGGFGLAVAVVEVLQWEGALGAAGGGDDGFRDLHGGGGRRGVGYLVAFTSMISWGADSRWPAAVREM